jgi:two-component system, OmpR family, sensor kinase
MMHSIRARLTAWYSLVLALVLVAFGAATYGLVQRQLGLTLDGSLETTAHELASVLTNEGSESSEALREASATGALLDFRYSDQPILIFAANGQEVASSQTSAARSVDRARLRSLLQRRAWGLHKLKGTPSYRLLLVPISVLGRPHVLAILHSLTAQEHTLADMRGSMLLAIPLAMLIAGAGGYLLARKGLEPVAEMSDKARAIGAENLAERITIANPRDELGKLGGTLNELLGRLEESFESQRRFMAEASHELRTPVAILQGEIDVSLSRDDREAADYRQSLQIMRRSVRKLTRIVHDLFLLARTDAGKYPINRQRFYFDETLVSTLQSFRTLAAECSIVLRKEPIPEILMNGDEHLLQRLVANLIENAIKYTPPGGEVGLHASTDGSSVRLEVRDTGAGIPPELRERIFHRFFRIAGQHTPGGGAGLGLPIALWIAEAHDGHISIEESATAGSTFVVVLPLRS